MQNSGQYWWLVRVILAVAFGFFAPKIWDVTGTYEWYFVKFVSAVRVDTALTAHPRQGATL